MSDEPAGDPALQPDGLEPEGFEDEDLERYVVRDSPVRDFVMAQLRRAPWWIISFLVHALALLIMWKWPYRATASIEVYNPIEVELVAEQDDTEFQEEAIEDPEPQDIEVPIQDVPIAPDTPTLDEPGPDLELPPEDELVKDVERPVPAIDPPSATPVFAVEGTRSRLNRGIYSGRSRRGRSKAVGGRGGTSRHAESSVMAGLKWLAKVQQRDGSWNGKNWEARQEYSVGMTGLALLCFLGAGYTDGKGPFKTTVKRGLAWLKAHQRPDGSFPWQTFYEQGIATMAVGEAYGLGRNPAVGRMAQQAVAYICKQQPDHGGYRYKGACPKGEGDISVTGWQIMAVKSGVCAELNVPHNIFDPFRIFLKNSWRQYGQSAYIVSQKGPGDYALTSVGMLCRIFIGGDEYEEEIRQTAQFLLSKELKGGKPVPGGASGWLAKDVYYTYYSALGMFQIGGEAWAAWNAMFRDKVVKLQVRRKLDETGRYVRGSWDPANHGDPKGNAVTNIGGRIYTTTLSILSLEVYYRFLPVYKR